MLHRLAPRMASVALPLLEGKDHLLLLEAVIQGTAPGYVMVDDPLDPHALFASGPEGHYLLGDPATPGFYPALKKYMLNTLIPDAIGDDWWYITVYYEPGWRRAITWLFGSDRVTTPMAPLHTRQRYFSGAPTSEDPPASNGLACLPVDAALLQRSELTGLAELAGFAAGDYGSTEAFLQHGFGLCLTREQELLAWCTTDCVVGERAELGIATRPGHRRQGHGALVARKMLAECHRRGIQHVGWHCFEQNLASAATALGAGLEERKPHDLAQYWLSPIDGHLVHANQFLFAGNYARARSRYLLAFEGALYRPGLALSHLFVDKASQDFYFELADLCRKLATDEQNRPALEQDLEALIAGTTLRQAGY